MLRNTGIPIVEIWDMDSSPIDMSVGINHPDAGFDMGRFLVGCGYLNVGCVGTSHDVANASTPRLAGFCKAVENGSGQGTKQLCLHDTVAYYPGFYGTEQLLASSPDIDGIFYQNDAMAFGSLQYCATKGIDVPGDIGIAGWGDLPIAAVLPKRLTSMHVPHLKLGQAAAEMMIAGLSDEPVDDVRDIGFKPIHGSTVRNLADLA